MPFSFYPPFSIADPFTEEFCLQKVKSTVQEVTKVVYLCKKKIEKTRRLIQRPYNYLLTFLFTVKSNTTDSTLTEYFKTLINIISTLFILWADFFSCSHQHESK